MCVAKAWRIDEPHTIPVDEDLGVDERSGTRFQVSADIHDIMPHNSVYELGSCQSGGC
jgi:hypothetical protein